jgi:hypothetical protein
MRSCDGMISSSHAHDRDGAKLETLREIHRSDRDLAQRNLDVVAEFDCPEYLLA